MECNPALQSIFHFFVNYISTMQKAIAIFFLGIFSVTATEAGQLFKVPVLIQHYIAHIERDHTTSFAHFIKQHYAVHNDLDGDEEKDSQLPFKSVVTPDLSIAIIHLPVQEEMYIKESSTKNTVYTNPFLLKDLLKGFFHPPRFT
jgi:hypothetical protein